MYIWYKFFSYLLFPIAPLYLYFRKIRKKEDPKRYKEKLSKINKLRGEGILVWFHVASVGEAMSILPLIENSVQDKKINKILITSITLSSGRILEKRFYTNDKVVHQYLPLDIPNFTDKFLKHWKPNLSIFIDSEIWPNLILQASKKKIPLMLVNARITKKTFIRWKFLLNFAKNIFEKFDVCIASNKESENFLKVLGAKNIKNFGNLKFSNIKTNLDNKLDTSSLDKIKNRKIWCAASTHPTEEIICAKSHMKVKNNYNNLLTIIIPRHVERTYKIKKELENLNLKVVLLSELNLMNDSTDILLVDAYGKALKFFNISKYVFLGKSLIESLKMDSGQNPIEPARVGCKIFHGPYVSNFLEIYEYLKTFNISHKIENSDELSLKLIEEFKEDRPRNNLVTESIENHGQNILNNTIKEVKKYINNYR